MRKRWYKVVLLVVLPVLAGCTSYPVLFRGILYPDLFFIFDQIDPPEPRASVQYRLDDAEQYPQAVFLIWGGGMDYLILRNIAVHFS
jgi:hypothetical protein